MGCHEQDDRRAGTPVRGRGDGHHDRAIQIWTGITGTRVYGLEEFDKVQYLGQGGFGEVCHFRWRESQTDVAIRFAVEWDPRTDAYKHFIREASILQGSHHHAVLPLLGTIDPKSPRSYPCLILRLMPKGSLADMVTK
jgi:serine/threonine protein kinase